MGYINKDITVRYEDVDKNNNLSLKGFLKYLIDAGSKHSDIAGYGINDIPKTKLTWFILNWKFEIYNYPHSMENIHIKTWTRNISKLYSYRDFEVFDDSGKLIAIASSKWVLVNYYTKDIAKITPEIINAYSPVEEMVFDKEIEKLKEPNEEYIKQFDYTILRRDLDANNHVNNLNYIDFAIETLPQNIYDNMHFNKVSVMYKKQCVLGDKIVCLYTKDENNNHIISIKSNDLKTLYAIVIFK